MKKSILQEIIDNTPVATKKYVQKQGEIAAQISTILKDRSIKQKEFAKMLDMKESQLSKILAGNANLTLKTIAKIEAELDADIIQIPLFKSRNVTVVHRVKEKSSHRPFVSLEPKMKTSKTGS